MYTKNLSGGLYPVAKNTLKNKHLSTYSYIPPYSLGRKKHCPGCGVKFKKIYFQTDSVMRLSTFVFFYHLPSAEMIGPIIFGRFSAV